MLHKKLAFITILLIPLAACQLSGPSAKDLAATAVADATKTQAALPPTATLSGPAFIKDDFEKKSDIWGKCDKCEWKDGKLYLGPFPARGNGIDQLFAITCEGCGHHSYFRIAADLTFSSGVAGDREFGVGLVKLGEFVVGSGIAPSQLGVLEVWDIKNNGFYGKVKSYGAINPGVLTNRVEFMTKPNGGGSIDYYMTINGKVVSVLSGLVKGSLTKLTPGIYLGWHSVGIAVDNFEYEEIVP